MATEELFQLPDGTLARMPEGMSEQEFAEVISQQFPPGTPVVSQAQPAPAQAPPEEEAGFLERLGSEALGGLETGAAVAVPVIAEGLAGIAGLARTITAGPEEGEKTITQIKEALSFDVSTDEAKRNLRAAGKILKPVGEILQKGRDFLGDTVFEATGSPGIATAAYIVPDAILEILGARGVSTLSRAGKVQRNANKIRKTVKRLEAENANKMDKGIFPAAPPVDDIFESASILYKEVDNFGATVKPQAFNKMADNLAELRGKLDPGLNPEASRLLDLIDEAKGQTLTASQVDNIRKKAGTVLAKGRGDVDSLVASRVRSQIDNLLGDSSSLTAPVGVDPSQISNRLKSARALYARGKRSELIGKLMASAELADNPRKALKVKFRNLIDPTKKTSKMFNAAETKAIRDFVKPGAKVNFLRLLGNFGLDLENVQSIQNLFVSAGGGAAAVTTALGPVGTVIALAGGTGSQWMAKRLLQKQSQFADQLIRAGRDAPEIVKTYLKIAKGKNRNISDLRQLLLNATPESIAGLPKTEFLRKVTEEIAATKKRIREQAVLEVVSRGRAFEEAVPIPALGLGQENGEQ